MSYLPGTCGWKNVSPALGLITMLKPFSSESLLSPRATAGGGCDIDKKESKLSSSAPNPELVPPALLPQAVVQKNVLLRVKCSLFVEIHNI